MERMRNRSSPAYTLGYCPECNSTFYPSNGIGNSYDEWWCDSCNAILDVWWVLSEMCSYSPPDPVPVAPFDPRFTFIPVERITYEHYICCDTIDCLCPEGSYLHPHEVPLMLSYHDLVPEMDIYETRSDFADCRACEHYMGYQCVPLRNWLRYMLVNKTLAPKLSLCYDYVEDETWCREKNIAPFSIYNLIDYSGAIASYSGI